MPGASSGGFTVKPTSLDDAARLLEEVAGELTRLAASFSGAFHAARGGAGEPDLERCLSLAALDFEEFTNVLASAAADEASKLRVASMDYVATDQDAAAGFDLASIPATAAPVEAPTPIGGPR